MSPSRNSQDRLKTLKARDVMSAPLVVLRAEDTVQKAASVFLDRNISGCLVLDRSGRTAGVFTKTDLVRYERSSLAVDPAAEIRDYVQILDTVELVSQNEGFKTRTQNGRVSDWMTPKVFSVDTDAPVSEVAREMIRKHVHRLLVRDRALKKWVGIITTFDVMRCLGSRFDRHTATDRRRK